MEPSNPVSDIYYPSIEDPDFNTKIVNNSEFSQYKTLMKDIPDRVILEEETRNICAANNFIHKNVTKVVKTYISPNTPYNGILLYHGVGVGKTCNSITIAEQFQDYSKKMNKKIYIIAPPSIVSGFKTEIHNKKKSRFDNRNLQCTFDKYEKLYHEYLNTLEGEEKNGDFLSKYTEYVIETPITFVNKYFIKGDFNKENYRNNIKKLFHNSTIIIDEVHNLKDRKIKEKVDISDGGITYEDIYKENVGEDLYKNKMIEFLKKNFKATDIDWNKTYTDLIEYQLDILNDEIKESLEDKKKEIISFFKSKYNDFIGEGGKELQHFLQAILSKDERIYKKNRSGTGGEIENYKPIDIQCKLLLLSATPMFDTYKEIKYLINLLKLNDKCEINDLIDDQDIDNIVKLNFDEIKESVNSKDNININNFLRKTQGYISYFKGDSPLSFPKKLYLNQNKQYVNSNNTQVIDKWNYSENFEDIEIENNDKKIINSEIGLTISIMNDKQEKYYLSPSIQKKTFTHKGKYTNFDEKSGDSCKMNTIKNLMFNKDENKVVRGKVFIFLTAQSNNKLNKTAIKNNILNWFSKDDENKFVEFDIKNENTLPNEKKNRVILIDSKKNDIKKDYIDIFNDEKNINGDYIKIIIGGETMVEGINLFGIRQIHILDPWWNISKNIQLVGRAFRNCSHILLPFEERNVTIFNHIAILENEKEEKDGKIRLKINPNDDREKFPGGSNPNIRAIFLLSQKTEDRNKIDYLIKINAFDCDLNKSNNFIKNFTDPFLMKVPFSNNDIKVSFNNKEDEYDCLGVDSVYKNNETKKIFGLDNNIQFIKYYIKNFFVEKNKLFFKFNELLKYLNGNKNMQLTNNELIHHIISIINNKEIIYDIFNRKCYLYKNNDYYLLNPIGMIKINKEIKNIENEINELRTKLNDELTIVNMDILIDKYKELLNSKIKLNSPSINLPYKNTFKFINNYMYFDKVIENPIENPIDETKKIFTLNKINPEHKKNYIFERCAYLENEYILCIPKQSFKIDSDIITIPGVETPINPDGGYFLANKVFKKVQDKNIYEVKETFIRHSQKPLYFYLQNENFVIQKKLNNLNENFNKENILKLVEDLCSKYKRVDQPLLMFDIEFLKINKIRIIPIKVNYDTLQILFKFLIKKIAKLYDNFKKYDTLNKYFELLLDKGFDLKYKEFNNINEEWNNIIDDETLSIYGWSKEELLFIYNNKHCFILNGNYEIGFILFKEPGTIVNTVNGAKSHGDKNLKGTTNKVVEPIPVTLKQQLPLQVSLNYSIGHTKPTLTDQFISKYDKEPKTVVKKVKNFYNLYKKTNSQHGNKDDIKGLSHLINLYSFNINSKKWKIFTNANNNNFIRSISEQLKKKYYIPYEVEEHFEQEQVLKSNNYIVEIHKNYKELLFIDRYIKLKNINTSIESFTNIRNDFIKLYNNKSITDIYSQFLWTEIENIAEQRIYDKENMVIDIWSWHDSVNEVETNKEPNSYYTNIINIETQHNETNNWNNINDTGLEQDNTNQYINISHPHLLTTTNLYFNSYISNTTNTGIISTSKDRIKSTNKVNMNNVNGFNIFKNITNYNILILFKYIHNFNLKNDEFIDIWEAQHKLVELNNIINFKIKSQEVNFIKILKDVIMEIKKKIKFNDKTKELFIQIDNSQIIKNIEEYYQNIQKRTIDPDELKTYLSFNFNNNHIINNLIDIDIYLVENNKLENNEEKDNLKIIISRDELDYLDSISDLENKIKLNNNSKDKQKLKELYNTQIQIKNLKTYYLLDKYNFGDRIWFLNSYEMTVMDGIKYWSVWKGVDEAQILRGIIYEDYKKSTNKNFINEKKRLIALAVDKNNPNNTTIENFEAQGGFTIFDNPNVIYTDAKYHPPHVEYQIFSTDELEDVKNFEKNEEWNDMDELWWKLEILFKGESTQL